MAAEGNQPAEAFVRARVDVEQNRRVVHGRILNGSHFHASLSSRCEESADRPLTRRYSDRMRCGALVLAIGLAACGGSRTETIAQGSFVIHRTHLDALGHYSHDAGLTTAGRTIGRSVQQYTVSPHNGHYVIWTTSCLGPIRDTSGGLPPCGVFWHDA